jgi:hypothetical protein
VHDVPIPVVVLDVRVDGHLRAANIQFGEHRLIGLELFGTAPGTRYIVFVTGRYNRTPEIIGGLVFCVTPRREPIGEKILLHVTGLNPPGRRSVTCY